MKSILISLSFLFITTSMAEVKKNQNYFIGFNGGDSITSNTSDFESDILFFKEHYFKSGSALLNAGGGNSTTIPRDTYGFIDRTIFGNVKFKPTQLPNSIEANSDNLFESINRMAQKEPKSVTILFTDHGGKSELAAWNEVISYKKIQSIDDAFGENTMVRRMHFHCYSGAAISKIDSNSLRISDGNSKGFVSTEFLSKYPKNRCAFSASAEGETSTAFIFDPYEFNEILRPLRNKKNAPSLADLKDMLVKSEEYLATPQLSSDYFLQDLSSQLCLSFSKKNQLQCSSDRSGLIQLQSMIPSEFCNKLSEYKSMTTDISKCSEEILDQMGELEIIKNEFAIQYLKGKMPISYKSWLAAKTAAEDYMRCKVVTYDKALCLAKKEKAKLMYSHPDTIRFYEQYLTIKEDGQYRSVPFTDVRYNFKTDNKEFDRKVEFAFQDYLKMSQRTQKSYNQSDCFKLISRYKLDFDLQNSGRSYVQVRSDLNYGLYRLERFRKKNIQNVQEEIKSLLLSYLSQSEAKEIKERFENIRQCELTPINQ